MVGDPKIELEKANHQLRESLKTCHDLVAEYRSKLAANGNGRMLLGENDEESEAQRS